jgi:predicted ATPase/DNA-binding winged helix-turn-helix (wHTH) protein
MSPQYRFGDFKLLPAERLLFRRGAEQALTSRAFAVLLVFVERAGQLVAKEELLRRVWSGLVVEENNLAVQVGVLRKLLGAEAITTIPGFGYRFALEVVDLGAAAPAEAAPHGRGNLPLRLPSLVGRETELAELAALLRNQPLITLCGGPGFGKTRLAQELALQMRQEHSDGAWWVDLTLLTEGEPPAVALARCLSINLSEGQAPVAALTRRLAQTAMLIVLDNAEHCVQQVAELAQALARDTAHTRILVTSQVPLHVAYEKLYRLAPLPLDAAVRLLSERAGGTRWEGVADQQAAGICRELDGNALAIELAAARIESLGLEGLAARLHQRLTLLTPGDAARPSRRNALASAMDWAYELLGERERLVLRRLGVFPGSFSLEAAALVLEDGPLTGARAVEAVLHLVDRSLVSVDRGTQPRYRLLETTRMFALEQLRAQGELEAAQVRLCKGVRWLFEDACQEFWHRPVREWRARYEPELPALWAALHGSVDHDTETALALFGASAQLWRGLASLAQVRALASSLSALVDARMDPLLRARFWLSAALCHSMVQPGLARDAAQRAARLHAELGDTRGEYQAWMEYAFNWRNDSPQGRAALARAKALENPAWPAALLERGYTTECVLHMSVGRHDLARQRYQVALDVCRRDDFEVGRRKVLLNLADLERADGQVDEAVRLGEMLLEQMADDQGSETLLTVMMNLVGALVEQGQPERARSVALDCRRRVGRLVLDDCAWVCLDALALLHLHEGRPTVAAQLAGASDRAFEEHGQPQRQPNETKDRAALDQGLIAQFSSAEIERLLVEGRRMNAAQAVALAFDLDRAAATPG